ncbi:iron-containing redox enzyme family protein [Arthrobacter sp. H35-D1]|uniref:iron-containing redox enzyme family protein n=1 Tax=Arthrobacter sp. H35-D1 TaxID=3046202 RepID=UPI0024BACA66|nr:iron-containing redox enzyme family protein [Arthrobacter sp. H35-D1]MDJ0315428.1 iron-containing redox enzyme family protein [Arthrobacter sp. H35-D1]
MKFPTPRGPLSSSLFDLLQQPTGTETVDDGTFSDLAANTVVINSDVLNNEDLQLTLFCLYELHYSGLDGSDERWEWNPGLIAARHKLEDAFEHSLRVIVDLPALDAATSDGVASVLFDLAATDTGPSMSRYVAKKATLEQLQEFLIHKSVYQLKEADPHTWAIPRLTGRPKAAMVEIQADEYGGGREDRMHSALFARTMRGLGLDDTYGTYIDMVPALTLASTNMMSLFGLNRRLRGAIVGHLAAYEMTSSHPNQLYGNGFRRHGFDKDVTWYFDEHVEADAVHEQIAGRDLAGGLFETEPDQLKNIYFGATAALALDALSTARTMSAWESGTTSLRCALSVGIP